MDKFLFGFALGLGVGMGTAMLLSPRAGPENRERLRARTDLYAAGDETPLGTVAARIRAQRDRIEDAIAAGRRASAERQAELWAELHLTPPALETDGDAPAAPTTPQLPT